MKRGLLAAVGVVAMVTSLPLVAQENRLYINDVELTLGSAGNTIPVLADNEVDVYAISIHIRFNPAKVQITNVTQGADVVALSPDYFQGEVCNSTGGACTDSGNLTYGILFDLSEAGTGRMLPGTGQEILVLTVSAVASNATTDTLQFVNDETPPARVNVFSDDVGDPIDPAFGNSTVTIIDKRPRIDSFVDNFGREGKEFFVAGANFDEPGIAVRLCNQDLEKDVEFRVLGDGSMSVIAPGCGSGPAPIQITTIHGSASHPEGFIYDEIQEPVITGFVNNRGEAGDQFFITGENFGAPGLAVRVCGVIVSGAQLVGEDIVLNAPACANDGWQPVEVCTDDGCDTEAEGFFYEPQGTLFIRGDANNDGGLDVSDPIAILNDLFVGMPAAAPCEDALDTNDDGAVDVSDGIYELSFLFGGGPAIPPPSPDPGLDPTPDGLADC